MRLIFLLTAIIFNGFSFAQDYTIRLFTTADGLPGSNVQALTFDSRGYMWLGLAAGICRFDGHSFTDYTGKGSLHNNNGGGSVFEDREHRFWIACLNKVHRFDHNRFYEIPISGPKPIGWIYCLLELPDGKMILSGVGGTFVFNGKNFEPYSLYGLPKETVFRTIVNLPGGLLVNTLTAVYERQGNNPWKILYKRDGLNWISSVQYHSGKKYFNDWDGAIYEISGDEAPRLVFKPPVAQKGTNAFFIDSKENLWVTSFDQYLYLVKKNGESSDFFARRKMYRYSIYGLVEDKWGNIWAGAFEGLLKISPSFVDSIAGVSARFLFRNMFKGKSCFYFFGGRNAVYRYSKGQVIKYPYEVEQKLRKRFDGIHIRSAAEDNSGVLWMVNNAGKVFMLSDQDFKELSLPVKITCVGAIKDKLFLASHHVLYRWINNRCQAVDSLVEGNPLNRFSTMMTDSRQRLWIADIEKLMLITSKGLLNISAQAKLPPDMYSQVTVFNNELWMITGINGIARIKESGNGQFHFSQMLNKTNGLASDLVLSFCFDKRNYLWYSTTTGIYRSKMNFSNDSIYLSLTRKFGENEGINNSIWDSGPVDSDEEGNIWVTAINGIYKIDAQHIPEDTIAPMVVIENAELMRSGADWKNYTKTFSSYHNLPANPQLPYTQNSISLYFNGITMNNASAVKFKYKLGGYDEDWSNLTSNHIATYTNLPPGKYHFAVNAMNSDGRWSPKPDAFEFYIAPPFWATWWFRSISALLIILSLYYLIRRREKIKLQKNQIALQIAELRLQALQSQMNPHFIFNSLNSVQNYILDHNPTEGARYLSKFSRLIRMILENSRHNLLPLHQIVSTLKMYMELEALRFNREFSYELQLCDEEDEIMNRKLPPMFLQPFVENAILHGLMPKEGEKKLKVSIQKNDHSLHCVVEDNGVGRKETSSTTKEHISRGEKMINDMLESLQQLLGVKAQIIISDLNGRQNEISGTRVEILIPEPSIAFKN